MDDSNRHIEPVSANVIPNKRKTLLSLQSTCVESNNLTPNKLEVAKSSKKRLTISKQHSIEPTTGNFKFGGTPNISPGIRPDDRENLREEK